MLKNNIVYQDNYMYFKFNGIHSSQYNVMIQNNVDDLKIITGQNYFFLQNAIRESLGEKAIEPPNPNEDPRLKRMKAKARYRDKIKAKKGGGIDLGSSLVAICCMGIGLTPLNIGKISYASVARLTTTY